MRTRSLVVAGLMALFAVASCDRPDATGEAPSTATPASWQGTPRTPEAWVERARSVSTQLAVDAVDRRDLALHEREERLGQLRLDGYENRQQAVTAQIDQEGRPLGVRSGAGAGAPRGRGDKGGIGAAYGARGHGRRRRRARVNVTVLSSFERTR